MVLIDRYLFRTVAGSTLVVMLVMLVLDMVYNLLQELENVGEGEYSIFHVSLFLLLTVPRRVYEILPMALLVGGLLGMGALAANNELTVLRASGLSRSRLIWGTLKAGLVLSLSALLIGEFVAPPTEQLAQQLRTDARQRFISIGGIHGFWAREGNYYINVRAIEPGLKLSNVFIYEVDDQSRLQSVTRAISAQYQDGRWLLEAVSSSQLSPERVTVGGSDQMLWNSVITPRMLEVLAAKPEDLSLRDLDTYIDYLGRNGQDTRPYQLALWNKGLAPFTHMAMLFVAMPFVFRLQRSGGIGQRLLVGILLGIGCFLLSRLLGNVVLLFGFHPAFGALLPTLLIFLLAAFALKKLP